MCKASWADSAHHSRLLPFHLVELDDALLRLAAYVEALDWLLTRPPEEPDVIPLLMSEMRKALAEARAAGQAMMSGEDGQ